MQAETTRDEVPALTALRMVAALLVFLYHFAPDAPGILGVAASEGHVGVTVFFVLSGFLITLRSRERMAQGRFELADYFVRRVTRIVPLYLVVLVVSGLARGDLELSLVRLPEWTLTQGLFSRSLHELWIPTSWSLTVEECFYATAPLLVLALARGRGVDRARDRAAPITSRISPSGFWSRTTSMAPLASPARVGTVSSWAMTRMLRARPEASSAATRPALPAPRL